jgi:hypothetical protein
MGEVYAVWVEEENKKTTELARCDARPMNIKHVGTQTPLKPSAIVKA